MFNIRKYAEDLFKANNPEPTAPGPKPGLDVKITERTLTNNQDYDEMIKNKFNWNTVTGPSPVTFPKDQDKDAVVALQPQRIRVFSVEYNVGPAPGPKPGPDSEIFLQ